MNDKECVVCKKQEHEIPLIVFDYKRKQYRICPQHLPLLIHDPQKLEGILPDAENFDAYEA